MSSKFEAYEYEKQEIPPRDDFREWIFRIKNTSTGVKFDYRINISGSAMASQGLPSQIQDAVDTQGESLVKRWLGETKETRIQCKVTSVAIDVRELGINHPWIDW